MESLSGICNQYHLRLIEDCAHVFSTLYNGKPVGSFGDAAIFSRRKFLPMTDGGELQVRNDYPALQINSQGESIAHTLRSILSAIDMRLHLTMPSLAFLIGCITRSRPHHPADSRSNATSFQPENADTCHQEPLGNVSMSRLSKFILHHCRSHYIMQRRRKNYSFLLGHLSHFDNIELFANPLPDDVCPMVFPLTIPLLPNAHLRLRHEGIPATHWGDVRPGNISQKNFPLEDRLYRDLIFLPIHQDLTERHLLRIIEAITKVLQESNTL
jgi:perosamine synthetase